MLSSLPPELLHQIIESTVPHTFHTKTYDNRQRTLYSLSLVSKRFRAIAQPLLHEIVWIASSKTLDCYKRTTSDAGEGDREVGHRWKPRAVVIESGEQNGSLIQETMSKDVAQVFSLVKSLTWDFESIELGSFPSLSGFSDLTNLQLSSISLQPAEIPKLPKLRSLTMCYVRSSLMASLLDPKFVPSLKHFSLVDCSAESVRQLKQSRILDLLPHLETLHLDLAIWKIPQFAFLHLAAERTLVDCYAHEISASTVGALEIVHLRLLFPSLQDSLSAQSKIELVNKDLSGLLSLIRSALQITLRSLYLDSSLRSGTTLPDLITETMDKLLDACRERSVEIVFDSPPVDTRLDSWISAEFVRRQSRSKSSGERGGSQ